MTLRIGFDIGGTKVAGALLDTAGVVLAHDRWPVAENYEGLLDLLAAATAYLEEQAGTRAERVGLGVPGIINHRLGGLSLSKLRWLEGQPLRADMAQRVHRPVNMANDADCFVLSEAVDGAAAEYHHVFGVILGTGVGGGQVVGKQLVTGIMQGAVKG